MARTARDQLIVGLDVPSADAALSLASRLQGAIGWVKVGMELFYGAGPDIVGRLRDMGFQVFVDLKLHDIPNTVAGGMRQLARLGAGLINVHAAGGPAMMRAAREAAMEAAGEGERPRVIGVTVLTSLDEQALGEIGIGGRPEEWVIRWSRLAREAGLDGVVASPHEVAAIRNSCGPEFLTVTPGIRPAWAAAGDQKRFTTPAEAVRLGADYLVVARPIIADPDPRGRAQAVLEEMDQALAEVRA